jgi:hypothetical protein
MLKKDFSKKKYYLLFDVCNSFIFLYYRRLKLATGFSNFYFLKKDGRQFSVATEISHWILD